MSVSSRAKGFIACALLVASSNCKNADGSLDVDATACFLELIGLPSSLALSELDQKDYEVSWISDEACFKTFGIKTRIDNPSLLSIQDITPTFETITQDGKNRRLWTADVHVWSLLPGQTNAHLDFQVGTKTYKTIDLAYNATPTRGDVNVNITGVPSGSAANVFVGVGREDGRSFTASGSARFLPGELSYQANIITGTGGSSFRPMPSAGIITSTAGGTSTLNIAYALDAGNTGTVNVQVGGLAPGLNGNVVLSGNGISPMTFTATGTVQLPAGNYTAQINNVSNANVDEADPTPSRNFTVTAGQTFNVIVAYSVIARLVAFQVTGLLAGLNPDVSFTRTGQATIALTALALSAKMAVGTWNVSGGDRVMSGHTYRLPPAFVAGLLVSAGFDPLVVSVAYYQAIWQFVASASTSVLLDQYGHVGFVALWLSNTINITRSFSAPAAIQSGLAGQQSSTETVTISGPSPFLTVTGTRAADGTLNLTGSGTAAGYVNVPAVLTGNMSNANVFTQNGTSGVPTYRLGQAAAPTGLPSGPITYNFTVTGAPASLQALFAK